MHAPVYSYKAVAAKQLSYLANNPYKQTIRIWEVLALYIDTKLLLPNRVSYNLYKEEIRFWVVHILTGLLLPYLINSLY